MGFDPQTVCSAFSNGFRAGVAGASADCLGASSRDHGPLGLDPMTVFKAFSKGRRFGGSALVGNNNSGVGFGFGAAEAARSFATTGRICII